MLFDSSIVTPSLVSFGVVAAAEMGDKSQLVCMALACKYPARYVLFGSIAAFLLLNLLAVILGASLSLWIPKDILLWIVAALFAVFGLQLLLSKEEEEQLGSVSKKAGHTVMLSTFMLIFMAELGDKTQLAVAAMSSAQPPFAVWLGASLALSCTSALGVYAGARCLRKMPIHKIHQASGLLFLIMALSTVYSIFA